MDLSTARKFRELLTGPNGPCISIYMPTHRRGEETQQDPIRFKNLVSETQKQLKAQGIAALECDALIEPLRRLQDDGIFWRHQSDALALFRSTDRFRYYRLPLTVKEQVLIQNEFHVTPLLPLMIGDEHFYILALSQQYPRLLLGIYREACTYAHVADEELSGTPDVLHEKELHERAWKLLEPMFKSRVNAALDRFRAALPKGRGAHDLPAILTAARDGRVQELF